MALRMSSFSSRDESDEDDAARRGESPDGAAPLPFYRSDNGTRESEFVGITRARGEKGKTGDSDNMYVNMLESLTPGEFVGLVCMHTTTTTTTTTATTTTTTTTTTTNTTTTTTNTTTTHTHTGEMVGQFMATAPPRVQAAVKNTVIGLLGSLRASPVSDF